MFACRQSPNEMYLQITTDNGFHFSKKQNTKMVYVKCLLCSFLKISIIRQNLMQNYLYTFNYMNAYPNVTVNITRKKIYSNPVSV